MNDETSRSPGLNDFTRPLIEKLQRHPKRVVFTEGEDPRVLRVAERLVREQAVVPILLGRREAILQLADELGVSLEFIKVLEPAKSTDFAMFCDLFVKMERYRRMEVSTPSEIVSRPHYFGSLMVQYGQADALVGGNVALPSTLFRALIHTVKPMPGVDRVYGTTILTGDRFEHFGENGMLFFADTALMPQPDIDQLATIALETGKLARHFLGRPARVAMLSHSSKGSALTEEARRIVAATALARERARKEYLELEVDGELQADVALDPAAAETKLPDAEVRKPADVLVFPNLDAAHISLKLLQHCAGAQNYGQLLLGLARPAAQVPRTATEETIFGTAAAVAVEAVKFHEMYPENHPL